MNMIYKFPVSELQQNIPIHIHLHCNKQLNMGSLSYLANIICHFPLSLCHVWAAN